MKIHYQISIDHLDHPVWMEKAKEFAGLFVEQRKAQTWFFGFSNYEQVSQAIHILKEQSLKWELVYHIGIAKNEINDFPAFLFGPTSIFQLIQSNVLIEKKLKDNELVKDMDTGLLIANERVKNILDENIHNIHFQKIKGDKGNDFYVVTINEFLNGPVGVLKTYQVNTIDADKKIYFLVTDGRYFINEEQASQISNSGLLTYHTLKNEGKVYQVPFGRIVSPRIAKVLIEHHICGLDLEHHFLALLNESDSIVNELLGK